MNTYARGAGEGGLTLKFRDAESYKSLKRGKIHYPNYFSLPCQNINLMGNTA